jgi:hypothetical protein
MALFAYFVAQKISISQAFISLYVILNCVVILSKYSKVGA